MPTDPDLSCIGAAINNDPSAFLPMLLAYIEDSVFIIRSMKQPATRLRFRTLTIA